MCRIPLVLMPISLLGSPSWHHTKRPAFCHSMRYDEQTSLLPPRATADSSRYALAGCRRVPLPPLHLFLHALPRSDAAPSPERLTMGPNSISRRLVYGVSQNGGPCQGQREEGGGGPSRHVTQAHRWAREQPALPPGPFVLRCDGGRRRRT
jgi:hypothetical protein